MKRFLVVIPILLLILNSCGNFEPTGVPASMSTAVIESLTATMWSPTPTETPDPPENKIVEWLNAELVKVDQPEEQLEQTLDARYLVTGVRFESIQGSSAQVFWVNFRCECPTNTNCCFPERMFVVLIKAMKESKDKVINKVPSNVGTIKVVCFDHTTQNSVVWADWGTVKGYLNGNISAYELGAQVYRTTYP